LHYRREAGLITAVTVSPASVTIDDVREAARRLDGIANRTPVIVSGGNLDPDGFGALLAMSGRAP
jgi:hypothetical protein